MICVHFTTRAQYTDRYWAFGDSAGINFKNLSNPQPANSILRVRGTCASICDSAGDLLFYCGSPNWIEWLDPLGPINFGYVINKNHQTMHSGDSLATTGWYQEMVIVPMPGNDSLFYLFYAGVANPTHGMYYSVVDINYNSGQGRVIQKNVRLRNDTLCDGITAVRHGNGRDWWVIVRSWKLTYTNDITVYLVDPTGVTAMPTQFIGTPTIGDGFYRLKFNREGTHLYNVSASGIIGRFDFNRCTGLFSNFVEYAGLNSPYFYYWGFEVSLDESKLYTSQIYQTGNQDTAYILQFDLNAPNFLASADTIYTYTWPDNPGLLEMGPDGKIYVAVNWTGPDTCFDYLYCYGNFNLTNSTLSVINHPDSAFPACDYQSYGFYLGGHKAYIGLPNNHNYELGALIGSPCDTLTVSIPELVPRNGELKLYFDKSWQTVFINAEKLQGRTGSLEFYSIGGQLLDKVSVRPDGGYFAYSSSFASQPDGLYIVRLQTDKEVLTGKFVKW